MDTSGLIETSVIICTYNPEKKPMNRVLNGLKAQTMSTDLWELIIVDNGSKESIDQYDISWHPRSKIVYENQPGLVYGRIKGIETAVGDLIVFVDQDNELFPDYLETALRITHEFPHVGAFGGNLIGDFEIEPPVHLANYLEMIAIREIKENRWSNIYHWETTPAGAGMGIRADVARHYAQNTKNNEARLLFGRRGSSMMSSEDIDMAYTAIDMGYHCGLFKDLRLTHIIPKRRLTEKYMLNLVKYNNISSMLLDYVRFKTCPVKIETDVKPTFTGKILGLFKKPDFEQQVEVQKIAANQEFHRIIKAYSL